MLQVLPTLAMGAIYLALSSPATTFGFLKAIFGCEYTAYCLSAPSQVAPIWVPGQQQDCNKKCPQIRDCSTMCRTGTGFFLCSS